MTTETIHTCSYSCERPGCIRAQRDELVAKVEALSTDLRAMRAERERAMEARQLISDDLATAEARADKLRAEVDTLWAEVENWKESFCQAASRAERLEKTLGAYQEAVNKIDDLIEYSLPMPPETKAALYAIMDDLTAALAKENRND